MMFADEANLEERLSEPTQAVVETLARLDGDILILGVAGKMGPSLARMARRAADVVANKRRVIGVARFTEGDEFQLRSHGVETIRCDLLEERAVAELPDAANVIYLVGRKFGSTENESLTWAVNCLAPAIVCRRYRSSRIVALSTGNVYGLVDTSTKGSRESDAPAPVGEYAMSCLGRERVFQHFSQVNKTAVSLIRLNYACDLRYGVLVDLASAVWEKRPVALGMSRFNTIWQGDANALILTALSETTSPASVFNVTGTESLSVRESCEYFGRVMDRTPIFDGEEQTTALLSDCSQASWTLGRPYMSAQSLMESIAKWVMSGGKRLGKPTHFESRDGRF